MTSAPALSRFRTPAIVVMVVALAAISVVGFPMAASATTFTVTSTLDDGSAGTLRYEVDAANTNPGPDTVAFGLPAGSLIELGNTITVSEGLTLDGSGTTGLVITGTGGLGQFLLFSLAPDTANQAFGVNDVIFDGTASVVAGWTGVAFNTTSGALGDFPLSIALTRVVAKNITTTFQGPALRVFAMQAGGSITITDSTFTANTSTVGSLEGGGALYFRGLTGPVTVTGSTFTGNAARSGGAIFLNGQGGGVQSLSVASSTFTGNLATAAGAPAVTDGRGGAIASNILAGLTVTGSTFSGNSAGMDGGAIAIDSLQLPGSTVSISTSSLTGNDATFSGGGFFTGTAQGSVAIANSTFSGNTLSTNIADAPLGNSVRLSGVGNTALSVTSSTFDEPGAFVSYAIAVEGTGTSALIVAHSTIIGPGAVGLRTLANSASTVGHTILWSTIAAAPDDALVALVPGANTIAVSWNLSTGSALAQFAVGAGNHFGVTNFGLGALANNGGPTQTRLPADSSPAHNDGDPAIVGAPTFDQRGSGFARLVQTIDIGAVEIQAPAGPALAATGVTINPWVIVIGVVLLVLGLLALLYARIRRNGAHRA